MWSKESSLVLYGQIEVWRTLIFIRRVQNGYFSGMPAGKKVTHVFYCVCARARARMCLCMLACMCKVLFFMA